MVSGQHVGASGRYSRMNGGNRVGALAPWLLLMPALIASGAFFVAPLAYLVIESFRQFSLTAGVGAFSFSNYARILSDTYYVAVLATTFRLAAIAAALCLIMGFPLALLLRVAPARLKGALVVAIIAPLLVSVIVRTFGWVVILGEFGLLNKALQTFGASGSFATTTHLSSETAVVVGLVHVFLPFMVLALYSALQKQQARLTDAAYNLGADPMRAFFLITLPLTLPGIVAGTTTVFAMSAGAYVTAAVLGGSKVMVIAILVYQQSIGLANWPLGAAIGVALLISTTAAIQLFRASMQRAFPRVLGQ